MTVQAAAKLLQVKPATVRRHIERGLEAVRIGGRVYTSREAIARFCKPAVAEKTKPNSRDRKVLDFARKQLGMRV